MEAGNVVEAYEALIELDGYKDSADKINECNDVVLGGEYNNALALMNEGKYIEAALKSVNDLGYKTVFWSFAYDDWDNNRQMRKDIAIKKVLANTHNGAVILLHPTSHINAKILPTLISEWKNMGYSFGSLYDVEL